MYRLILSTALVILGGCATTDSIDRNINKVSGKDINWLISKWGYPDEEKIIAGKKLYVWEGGSDTIVLPFSQESFTTHTCHREVEIGKDDKVIGYNWSGNIMACGEATGDL